MTYEITPLMEEVLQTYNGPESRLEPCAHHPGTAVFHEGMKYWSCCQRKTSNFSAFLEQEGCAKGDHNWSKVGNRLNSIELSLSLNCVLNGTYLRTLYDASLERTS